MVALKTKRMFGCVAIAAVALASPVHAQFLMNDPIDEVLEGIGLKTKERDPIDYRERAPLVVPPSGAKLRTPEDSAAARNGQWPQDPDVLARRRKAEQAKLPSGYQANETRDTLLVGPGEGRKRNNMAGVPTRGAGSVGGEGSNPATAVSPDQVGRIMASSSDKPLTPGTEPNRQFLTEPPKGYRRAAAGAPVKRTVEPMRPSSEEVEMNVMRQQR